MRSLGQDEKGRLWNVLWMASLAVWGRVEQAGRRFSPGESVRFLVTVRPRPGHGRKKLHAFLVIANVGDDSSLNDRYARRGTGRSPTGISQCLSANPGTHGDASACGTVDRNTINA